MLGNCLTPQNPLLMKNLKNRQKTIFDCLKEAKKGHQAFFALRSVHQDASFELLKAVFGQFFKFVIIGGFVGVKNLPDKEKKVKQIPKKNLHQLAKRNKKMGGRSHFMKFSVLLLKMGHSSVHCTVY